MNKVIVMGSLNMDLSISCARFPQQGETLQGYDFLMNPGGKGGNQAVACSRSQVYTEMIAKVGDDLYGRKMKSALQQDGVSTAYVRTEKGTSSGVALVLRSEGDNRIVVSGGANFCLRAQEVSAYLQQSAHAGDIFLCQLETDLTETLESIRIADQMGLYTVLNPTPAHALPVELFSHLALIVVNQSECEQITGIAPVKKEDRRRALEWFAIRGCDAIITLGKNGSAALWEGTYIEVDAIQVKALDTTGAGDTYIGVLCAALARQLPLQEAMEQATYASALAVMHYGAQAAIPKRAEIEAFRCRVKDRTESR